MTPPLPLGVKPAEPVSLGTRVTELASSLLQQVHGGFSVKPKFAFLAPGTSAAWDDCCAGRLWVRVVGVDADERPAGRTRAAAMCKVTEWRVRLEVAVIRCVATINDQGVPPSARQMGEDEAMLLRDMGEMQAALQDAELPRDSWLTLGSWSPLGPDGGCAGGQWIVTVTLPDC